MKRQK